MENRKRDHIELAFKAQTPIELLDNRFHYEPLLGIHPNGAVQPISFLGKTLKAPIWVSSMTGGTEKAGEINRNLARVCNEFGLGMGLGSCRALLNDNTHFDDFNVRNIIGTDLPLYANLGICQIEQLFTEGKQTQISELIKKLEVDGLIVHINPMQEWFQPEGDRLTKSALTTIKQLLDFAKFPIIIKEVGQGFGPESIKALLSLPIAALEFGAFGGTNFPQIENLRQTESQNHFEPLSKIGVGAAEMIRIINEQIVMRKSVCTEIIISGGVNNFLDGYYLVQKSNLKAIYGQALQFLKYAQEGYEPLQQYVASQIQGYEMAKNFLKVK